MNFEEYFKQETLEAANELLAKTKIDIIKVEEGYIYANFTIDGETFTTRASKENIESGVYKDTHDDLTTVSAAIYLKLVMSQYNDDIKELVEGLTEENKTDLLTQILTDHPELIPQYQDYFLDNEGYNQEFEDQITYIEALIEDEHELDNAYNQIALLIDDLSNIEDESVISRYIGDGIDSLMEIAEEREDLQESIQEFIEEYSDIISTYTDLFEKD